MLWRLSLRGEAGLFLLLFYLLRQAAKRPIFFMRETPPLYTVADQLVGWTLDRTADFPKSQRFTFGQRLDNLSLDCLQQVVRAIYSTGNQRHGYLSELNLKLEELRVLWRLVQQRGWITQETIIICRRRARLYSLTAIPTECVIEVVKASEEED